MDFYKYQTKEEVLVDIWKLKERLNYVSEEKADKIRFKIKVLLNFYKNFDEAQVELR